MSYTVLARRFRSRDFDELVGQEPIARTLENAIGAGRTAHAYLFCGTRGVGKTSMARIFARALNVTQDLEEADSITDAIFRGDDLDVVEIDGASNRGINEARDLIAGAGLSPTRSPYKIYIIDEVHMLTREAFNALLKTMEEPPSHVKFILCTTEAHKVPATIQSRCQRFDFRPLPASRIATHLAEILEKESVQADQELVLQVARMGNGSMRDALSLLDRLLASGSQHLTVALLEEMVGLPDHTLISSIVDALIDGDGGEALQRGAVLLESGVSVDQALEFLAEHFRSLMLLVACGPDTTLVELAGASREAALRQSGSFDAPGLAHLIAVCDATLRAGKGSTTARALFDAALVRLSMAEHFADVTALLAGGGGGASTGGKKKAPRPDSRPARERGAPVAPREDSATAIEVKPASAAATAPTTAVSARPPSPGPSPGTSSDSPRRPAAPAASSPTGAPAPEGAAPAAPIDGAQLWAQDMQATAGSPGDRARLESLHYRSFDGRTLTLSVPEEEAELAGYLRRQKDAIADCVKRTTGRSVKIEIIEPDTTPKRRTEASVETMQEIQSHPAVRRAMDLFGATIIDVRDVPNSESDSDGRESAGDDSDSVHPSEERD
ncbi:MAG: DNA polymerase III subunit gamma/tau [Planctomycetota bacterium]